VVKIIKVGFMIFYRYFLLAKNSFNSCWRRSVFAEIIF